MIKDPKTCDRINKPQEPYEIFMREVEKFNREECFSASREGNKNVNI